MAKILRLDDADQRIEYNPPKAWRSVKDSGEAWNPDGTYHQTSSPGSQIFLLFRGTSISLYGRTGAGGGILKLIFDGVETPVYFNSTDPGSISTRVWQVEGLEDGDHEIIGSTTTVDGQGLANIWLDYFELENTARTGFEPIWAGTNATNIPREAKVIDNTDANIQFCNTSRWSSSYDARFYSPSLRHTTKNGASLTYTFKGTAIWYYSDRDIPHGNYTVSIDGSPPELVLNGRHSAGQITRQMLWSKTDLSDGQHNFTLTHNDTDGTYVSLDYFRILHTEDPTTPDQASVSTPNNAPSSNVQSRRLALAIGLPIGILVLASLVLFLFLRRRKRQRRISIDLTQDTDLMQSLPFIMPGHSLTVPPKQGPASPAHSSADQFGSPETTSVSMPPPYEEHLPDNGVDAPRTLTQ